MKKIISILMVATLSFSISLNIFAKDKPTFADMPDQSHWSYDALNVAVEQNLLSGSDGLLLPFDNLTRAQMATILVRAYKKTQKADLSSFVDVPQNAWFYDSMAIAVKEGWFKGDGTGYLNPNSNITRQEVFVVISRVLGFTIYDEKSIFNFSDFSSISDWAKQGTSALVFYGIVNGSSDGNVYPQNLINRSEFSQIMLNMKKLGFLVFETKTEIEVIFPNDGKGEGGLELIDSDKNDENFGEVNFGN